jgi:hypothetical protein
MLNGLWRDFPIGPYLLYLQRKFYVMFFTDLPSFMPSSVYILVNEAFHVSHITDVLVEDLKAGNILCRTSLQSTRQAVQSVLQTDPSILNPPERSSHVMVQSAKSQPLLTPNLTQALDATYILGDFGHGKIVPPLIDMTNRRLQPSISKHRPHLS